MQNNTLKQVLAEQDLEHYQSFILKLSQQLGVSVLESAAALLYHHKINISFNDQSDDDCLLAESKQPDLSMVPTKSKKVRYRLEIGRKHQVKIDEIKQVLIEVSGVEKIQIGRLDIRNHYTLVDLPYGMPADIFQLLSETEINDKKLNIKRIKSHRRNYKQQKTVKKRLSHG